MFLFQLFCQCKVSNKTTLESANKKTPSGRVFLVGLGNNYLILHSWYGIQGGENIWLHSGKAYEDSGYTITKVFHSHECFCLPLATFCSFCLGPVTSARMDQGIWQNKRMWQLWQAVWEQGYVAVSMSWSFPKMQWSHCHLNWQTGDRYGKL